MLHHRWRTDIFIIIAVLFLRAGPGFVLARLSAVAPVIIAAVLFAIPADEARAHNDNSATLHAETYPLHEAAKAGDLNSVNHFITVHMADVDAKGNYGNTPLHYAAHQGNASVASILIASGADVNANNDRYGYGDTPLHYAALRGNASVASILIAAGADVNAKSNSDKPLHDDGDNASVVNAFVVSILLIAAGAEVNAKSRFDQTPLHYAVHSPYASDVVSVLIAAGADVNAKDDDDKTPLHEAARYASVVSILIAAGADVNAKSYYSETPLHYAVHSPYASVVSILIAAGADVNAKNRFDQTPLHDVAAGSGNASVVSILIAAGAEVNAKNKYGYTPLHRAARYASVVSILIAAGGHWGEVCENAAVVNPAGPSPPCLCESPNVGTPEDCVRSRAQVCAGLTPPKFHSPTLSACAPYDECVAAGDCALSAHVCRQGFSPARFYDSATGECVPFGRIRIHR